MLVNLIKSAGVFAILLFHSTVLGQSGPPDTEIFLVDLQGEQQDLVVGRPHNVTNRVGYDNQPFFLPSGDGLLYTAIDEDGQADIFQHRLHEGKTVRLTDTPESEYSPTPMPNGKTFSVVRVEADSSQRLWQFPISGGEPSLILPDVKPVGYHAWLNKDQVALFVLGDPNSLYLAEVSTGQAERIIGEIGRSLHRIPNRERVSFVHKVSEQEWWIKQFEPTSGQIEPFIQTLEGSEDYCWTPDGGVIMGQDSQLFQWRPETDQDWSQIANFEELGLKNITRVAVSATGKKLAVVAVH